MSDIASVSFLVLVCIALVILSRPRKKPRQVEEEPIYRSTKSPVDQLTSMGFCHVGTFKYSNGLQLSLTLHVHDTGVYAFVIGDEIKYIGKTRDLYNRMTNYRDSGPHDPIFTNRNVNQNLKSSDQTQILLLSKEIINTAIPSQFDIKEEQMDYHVVESIFILRYKPPWNIEGVRD